MSPTPKTIQIFLPGGDPQGIRVAEITTRIVQVIEVPRSLLPEFLKMPESGQVALYFLIGESEDAEERRVYVGQTGDLRARLVKHNKEKEFWERALVVVSRTNSLTQTHALFLEWHCLQAIRAAARFVDENGNSGSKPHTPPPMEADCHEIFDTGRTLLATLGYPLFDSVTKSNTETKQGDEIFYCKSAGCDGRGLYTPEGFVVLKGSIGRKGSLPSIANTSDERFRNKLITAQVMRVEGDKVLFEKDHLFNSPSMAAVSLLGGTANGWTVWKSKDGKTLDELKRQNV
ncbi:MAG: excinuclease ABC subunit C [Burkholderiales bacterium PBB4]|nr:MAG: excinuclease ABC subunit C [Burkholderiales bacterium PBB4]